MSGHLRYIKGLDALRAFAVITVIITHWGPTAFHSETLSFLLKLFPNGNFGVDLFFVLSGFLITRILINSRFENEETDKFQLIKAFFIRRSLRIFPIYFLLVLVLWAIGDKPVGDNIWYFLTYTSNLLIIEKGNWYSNLSHTWSLAVEEQFYLLWPWIIVFVPKKYLLSAILGFLGLGIVSSLMLYVLCGKLFYILMPPCLIAFSIGATYAYVEYDRRFEHFLFTTLKILLPICLIGYLLNQFGHGFVLIRLINSII
ncbi:MAG: acyltransferase, partial [Pedobacter sp.]|nr:acyltransferase [Pedobacter sp.]